MKKLILFLTGCFFVTLLFAKETQDSSRPCSLRISLLTCTPGAALYSSFGHSAIRVSDPSIGSDVIYNYGTFDFNDPGFYSKFTRGKLLYFVSVDTFANFYYEYEYEQRGITEQVLDLSCEEKQNLVAALAINAREENKYYKYDFVYDNCTTRLRDIILSKATGSFVTRNIRPQAGITFRNLIHEYLDRSHQHWSKLGIDILLGSPLDKKISNDEAMFLPDYLLKAFDSTIFNGKPLVSAKKEILPPGLVINKAPVFTPFIVFALLFLAIAVLSFVKKATKFLYYFDFIFFFICGVLGALLLFMWFGTDHQTCRNNFNLAWAFPGHLVIVFFLSSKKKWPRRYFLIYSILLLLLLVAWKWLPQEMNNALLPVVVLLLLRSLIRSKKLRDGR